MKRKSGIKGHKSGVPHGEMTQNRGDYKVSFGLTKENKEIIYIHTHK